MKQLPRELALQLKARARAAADVGSLIQAPGDLFHTLRVELQAQQSLSPRGGGAGGDDEAPATDAASALKEQLAIALREVSFAADKLLSEVLLPALAPLYASTESGVVADIAVFHLRQVLSSIQGRIHAASQDWEAVLTHEQERSAEALTTHSSILQVLCLPFEVNPSSLLEMFRASESARETVESLTRSHQQQQERQAALDKGLAEEGYIESENSAQIVMLQGIHRLRKLAAMTAVKEKDWSAKKVALLAVADKVRGKGERKEKKGANNGTKKAGMAETVAAFKLQCEADKLEKVRADLVQQTLAILEQHQREVQEEVDRVQGLLLSAEERARLADEKVRRKERALADSRRTAALLRLDKFFRFARLQLRFERRRRIVFAITIQCAWRVHRFNRRVKQRVAYKTAVLRLASWLFEKCISKIRHRHACVRKIALRLRLWLHRLRMKRIITTTLQAVKAQAMRLTRGYCHMVTERCLHLEQLVLALRPADVVKTITERIAGDFDKYEVVLEECDEEAAQADAGVTLKKKKKAQQQGSPKKGGKKDKSVSVADSALNQPLWQELASMRATLHSNHDKLDDLDRYAASIRQGIRTSLRLGALSQTLGLDFDDELDDENLEDANTRTQGRGGGSNASLHGRSSSANLRGSSANLQIAKSSAGGAGRSSANFFSAANAPPTKPRAGATGLGGSSSKSAFASSAMVGRSSTKALIPKQSSSKMLHGSSSKAGSKKSQAKVKPTRVRTFVSSTSHLYRGLPVRAEPLLGDAATKAGEEEDYGLEGLRGPMESKGLLYARMVQDGKRVDPATLLSAAARLSRQTRGVAASLALQKRTLAVGPSSAVAQQQLQANQKETRRAVMGLTSDSATRTRLLTVTTGVHFFHGTHAPVEAPPPTPAASSLIYRLATVEPTFSALGEPTPVAAHAPLVGCDLLYHTVAPFALFQELQTGQRPARTWPYLQDMASNVLAHMSLVLAQHGLLPSVHLGVPSPCPPLGYYPLPIPSRSFPPHQAKAEGPGLGLGALNALLMLRSGLPGQCSGYALPAAELAARRRLPGRASQATSASSPSPPPLQPALINTNELALCGALGPLASTYLPTHFLVLKCLQMAYKDGCMTAALDLVGGMNVLEERLGEGEGGEGSEGEEPGSLRLLAWLAVATTTLRGVAQSEEEEVTRRKCAHLRENCAAPLDSPVAFLVFASYICKVVAMVARWRSEDRDGEPSGAAAATGTGAGDDASAILDAVQVPSSGVGAGVALVPEGSATIHADVVGIPREIDLPTALDALQYVFGVPILACHAPAALLERLYACDDACPARADALLDSPEARELRRAVDIALGFCGIGFRRDFGGGSSEMSATRENRESHSAEEPSSGSASTLGLEDEGRLEAAGGEEEREEAGEQHAGGAALDNARSSSSLTLASEAPSEHVGLTRTVNTTAMLGEARGSLLGGAMSPSPPSSMPPSGACHSPLRTHRAEAAVGVPLLRPQASQAPTLGVQQRRAEAAPRDMGAVLAASLHPVVITNVDRFREIRRAIDVASAQNAMAARMLDNLENLGTFSEDGEGEEEDEEDEEDEEEAGRGKQSEAWEEGDDADLAEARHDRNMTLFELQERRSAESSVADGSGRGLTREMQAGDTVPEFRAYIHEAKLDPIALAAALYPLHLEQQLRVHEYVELGRLFHACDSERAGFLHRRQWDALCEDLRCGGVGLLPAGAKLGHDEAAFIFQRAVETTPTGQMAFCEFRWAWSRVKLICV